MDSYSIETLASSPEFNGSSVNYTRYQRAYASEYFQSIY